MRRLTFFLIAAIAPSYAAPISSSQPGNWSSTSTWTGGVVPGAGDTVTLTHAVAVDVDTTVGTTPEALAATANATNDNITATGANYAAQTAVRIYSIGGSMPGGLIANNPYYVCPDGVNSLPGDTFGLQTSSTCAGGVPGNINITSAGSNVAIITRGTPAIQINNGGSLTCNTVGVDLFVRGDVLYANPGSAANPLNFGAGCRFWFDPSATPSGSGARTITSYVFAPSGTSGSNATILLSGTSANHVTFGTHRPNGDEARGLISINNQFTNINRIDANWTDFVDLGDTTNKGIEASTATLFRFQNSKFTRCGLIGQTATEISGSTIYQFEGFVFEDSLGTGNIYVNVTGTNPLTSGTRRIVDGYFDKAIHPTSGAGNMRDFTMDYVVVATKPSYGTSSPWFLWSNSFFTHSSNAGITVAGDFKDVFFLAESIINSKEFNFTSTAANRTIDGGIIQLSGATNPADPDAIASINAAGPSITHTIKNTIILPVNGVADKSSGTLLATGTSANAANHTLEGNTYFGGGGQTTLTGAAGDHGPFLSEGVSARADTITSYRGNIRWDVTRGTPGYHGMTANATLNDNQLSAANAEYNTCFNCGTVSLAGFSTKDNFGTHYWFPMSGGIIPGNGDVNEDPKFVDSARNAETWAASEGISPADLTGILAALKAGDRKLLIPRLLNHVRRGYAPRNIKLAKTAAPNGYIGAVKPILMFGTIAAGI